MRGGKTTDPFWRNISPPNARSPFFRTRSSMGKYSQSLFFRPIPVSCFHHLGYTLVDWDENAIDRGWSAEPLECSRRSSSCRSDASSAREWSLRQFVHRGTLSQQGEGMAIMARTMIDSRTLGFQGTQLDLLPLCGQTLAEAGERKPHRLRRNRHLRSNVKQPL